MNSALLKRAFDLFRRNQRARRIVHGDVFRFGIDPIQASPNRILSAFTAGDDRAHLLKARIATDFSDFIMPFFSRHDYDFAGGRRVLERTDCVSDHWFARDCGKQFIESHALATAARDDDCA